MSSQCGIEFPTKFVIPPQTIPQGTMILSFVSNRPTDYTLQNVTGSPGLNWQAAVSDVRQWNVGVSKDTDFWTATLPSDDIAPLATMEPWTTIGAIRFGLSMLPGSPGAISLGPVSCSHPSGRETSHDFCFYGHVTGSRGLNTVFPLCMRTEVICRPIP